MDLNCYQSVPSKVEKVNRRTLGSEHVHVSRAAAEEEVELLIKEHVHENKYDVIKDLFRRRVMLNPHYKHPKQPPAHTFPKRLSNKAKKKLGLLRIPSGEHSYSDFLPLHELWLGYMEQLLQIRSPGDEKLTSQLSQKVSKADYHGSIVRVWRSKCPSYVGTEGILLQETQNTLRLIAKDNKIRNIPKAHSIFTFELQGYRFYLYGDHMKFKASERSAKKFKEKPTIDL